MKFILALVLAFTFAAASAQSGFVFPNNQNRTTIRFQLISNLIFIPIEVNGVTLTFLVDTGVDETILLSVDDQDEVALNNVRNIKLQGLGSEDAVSALVSTNNKLSVGGLVDLNHTIYIVLDQGFNFSEHVGIPVNGIIGYNFFKDNIIKLDYDRKKIFVYQKNSRKHRRFQKRYTKIPITIEQHKPYVMADVMLDDGVQKVKMLLDNGNSDAIWLFDKGDIAEKLPRTKLDDFLGKGFSGDIFGKRSRINSFSINKFNFVSPLVAIPDSTSIKSANMVENRAGSIGSEILRRFSAVIDYPNNAIYLKPNSHYDEPFNYNMSGMEVQHDGLEWVKETVRLQGLLTDMQYDVSGNHIRADFVYKVVLKPSYAVGSVRQDSPADRVGIKKGDKLVKINSQSTNQYSLQQINTIFKSEEGKTINIELDRAGQRLKLSFQLEKIL